MERKTQWHQFDDVFLVEATKAGHTEAFDELIHRYISAVRGMAFCVVGHREFAEDIMQEALLIAYRSIRQLKQPERFPSWLCTIVRRCAIRSLRNSNKHKQVLVPLMEHEPSIIASSQLVDDVAEEFDQNEAIAALHKVLHLLPHEYQIVLELRYWRRMKAKMISEALGLPETTVKWRLHKAVELLAQMIGEARQKETYHEQDQP